MSWISVKDKLPEGDETVILFGRRMLQRGFFVEPGHRSEGYMDVWVSCEWDGCGGYEEFEEVTHWMPLPEPPKEEE